MGCLLPNLDRKYSIGINSFGESAPGGELLEYFGFTSQNIIEHAEVMLKK